VQSRIAQLVVIGTGQTFLPRRVLVRDESQQLRRRVDPLVTVPEDRGGSGGYRPIFPPRENTDRATAERTRSLPS
jgi:hypothetical protein